METTRWTPAYNPPVPQTSPITSSAGADRCPGVLRLAEAADGFLARIRLPGGIVSGAQLRALARLAADFGDGRAELTSRGNVQLRGLAADAGERLATELTRAGLLPSLTHDRVRNILASPLTDRTALVRALDAGLCARPRLAELSGRFLFAIDDGRGDVAGLGADVVATVSPAGAVVNGLATTTDSAVDVMLACAEAFLDLNTDGAAWRIADLPDGASRVREAVAARFRLAVVPGQPVTAPSTRPVGLVHCHEEGAGGQAGDTVRGNDSGSAAVLLAPLGRLTAAQLTWLADRGGQAARITPWRSVVLPDRTDAAEVLRAAAAAGFGVDAASPWLRVTACAGRPGCASALADVQADALSFAARWPGRIVHVSGCGRHCGRPAGTEIDVTATSEGYQIAPV
jgi:precorrin-3B synthase